MINTLYTSILRPGFFRMNPETAHHLTVNMLRLAGAVPLVVPILQRVFASHYSGPPVKAFGLTFPNPVGLAAGYDKEGEAIPGLASLGFGHIEIGTITPRAQPGNPAPRVFRIPAEEAVINRMGFPNRGADPVVACLRKLAGESGVYGGAVLGVNLGKNKVTPLEKAAEDYTSLIRSFAPVAGYLAINVSSPNTPDLRKLQSRAALEALLGEVSHQRQALLPMLNRPLPILVKLAPDLSWSEIDDAMAAIEATGMDGVIATNTTLSRTGLHSPLGSQDGGLSGAPLRSLSTEIIRYIVKQSHLPVVGVGGIMNPQDACEKLDAGAVLIQLYTGMIFAGPGLVQTILNTLH
jgi:dihydroorotate dehydrogenase